MSQILSKVTASSIGAVIQINGDTGTATPIAGVVNVYANHAANNAGSSVIFTAAGNSDTFNVTDANDNTLIGLSAGNLTLTTANLNTGVGFQVLEGLTTGDENSALGSNSLNALTTGINNVAIGSQALPNLITGSSNISIGQGSGSNLVGAESNDILIGHAGVGAESATIRIGTPAVQTATFIAGIDGVDVGSVVRVVSENTNQLGTVDLTAGLNISISPSANAITIAASAAQYLTNYSVANATPYIVTATDFYITVDTSTIAITIELPDAPTIYRRFVIKDSAGNAAVNNVTVTTVSGIISIDASPTFVMNSNWESIELVYDGFGYQIF